MKVDAQLCDGVVVHTRSGVAANSFRYPTTGLLVDVDQLDELERKLFPLFGHNSARPLAIRTRDHLKTEQGSSLRLRALSCLQRHGIDPHNVGRVRLHAGLRTMGYGFNPASVWFCEDTDGGRLAIIVEVNNTYGESHQYVVGLEDQAGQAADDQTWIAIRDKKFHVSPFLPLDMSYRLRVTWPDGPRDAVVLDVRATTPDRSVGFAAVQVSKLRPLNRRSLVRANLRFPTMARRTTLLIHWRALIVWLRGAPFSTKPPWKAHVGSFERK